jgi:hypothetical protein
MYPLLLLPVSLDHVHYHPMIFVLLQPTDHNNRHHALHALHTDRHRAAVDGVPGRLLRVEPVLCREGGLVPGELAVHHPRGAAEAQHGGALASDPDRVIGRGPRPRNALEDDLLIVGKRDADGRRLARRARDGNQPGVQQVAQVPGVICGEGAESEAITLGEELVNLAGEIVSEGPDYDVGGRNIRFPAELESAPGRGRRLRRRWCLSESKLLETL